VRTKKNEEQKKRIHVRKQAKIWVVLIASVLVMAACNDPNTNGGSTTSNNDSNAGNSSFEGGALVAATSAQDLVKVEQILAQPGYDVNERNANNENAILIATHLNNLEIARKLIDAGANVNMQDNIQDSAYLYAGAQGRTEILRYMLSNADPQPNQTVLNRYGGNALIPAAEKGHIDNVRLLLEDGRVDINLQNNFGYTALIEAVALTDGSKLYQDIVKILVDHGARIDLKDKTGRTALDYAQEKGYNEMVQLLR